MRVPPRTRTLARFLRNALAVLGALLILVTVTPVVSWWARLLSGRWHDPKGDTLIVLGAATVGRRMLGLGSHWRTVYAILAWEQGSFRQVIVSGGEAAPIMRNYLACSGVPAVVIQVESRSASTRESALYVKPLLAGVTGTNVLLTSDYHMFRAHRAFAKAGVEVTPSPFPDAIKRSQRPLQRWGVFMDLMVETGKIVYYYARGWI